MALRFISRGSDALLRIPGTQAEKAQRVGADRSTVSLWQNGERSPRRDMRLMMERAWGILRAWWDEPLDSSEAQAA